MDADSSTVTTAQSIERLQQAVRVMENLSDIDRTNFHINVVAVRRESGISACIAGHCGMDPWFQAQGFITRVGEGGSIGEITLDVGEFFGTESPFYHDDYEPEFDDRAVTVDDAISALRQAIQSFPTKTPRLLRSGL